MTDHQVLFGRNLPLTITEAGELFATYSPGTGRELKLRSGWICPEGNELMIDAPPTGSDVGHLALFGAYVAYRSRRIVNFENAATMRIDGTQPLPDDARQLTDKEKVEAINRLAAIEGVGGLTLQDMVEVGRLAVIAVEDYIAQVRAKYIK